MVGTTISHYGVIEKIGQGGMGPLDMTRGPQIWSLLGGRGGTTKSLPKSICSAGWGSQRLLG